MGVKKHQENDGIFKRNRKSVSRKETPPAEFAKAMKAMLLEPEGQKKPDYILNTLERNAQAILKQPAPEVQTTSKGRQRSTLESYERRKRDEDVVLFRIKIIRAMRRDKKHDQAFVEAFHLGQIAIKADSFKGLKRIIEMK